MSVEITVELPGELVAFMDELVTQERATSRAEVVAVALDRLRRRVAAEQDAHILARPPDNDNDLDDLAHFAASLPAHDDMERHRADVEQASKQVVQRWRNVLDRLAESDTQQAEPEP